MSNYTKATNFASKDSLLTGNPSKIVKGTEIDNEFNAISTAISTKFDTASLAAPGPIGATTPAAISGTTIIGTTGTFSGDVQMASQNGAQLAGMRNKVTNGDMRVCQRATSTAGVTGTTQAFFVDRFRTGGQATSAVFTTSQSTDVPNNNIANSARLTVTTADTAIAATDILAMVQPIEGYNIKDLFGNTFTLSFWVRSSKTGIHCVAFTNAGPDRSYVVEYTISVANTWEYKTITVSGGLTTAGSWDLATGTGISLRFALMAGSSFQTTAGAWNTGNFFATSNQVNCLDTIGNIFAITGVQLEVGPVATPFEQRPYGMELALCQRYYYRATASAVNSVFGNGWVDGANTVRIITPFPVTMRTAPSALEQSGTASNYQIRTSPTAIVVCTSAPAFSAITSSNLAGVQFFVTSGLTAGQGGFGEAATIGAYLGFSAEL